MRTSEQINELATALAKAQGEFTSIEKNRTGKVMTEKAQFSYDYADLSDVIAAVRPALSKHGLSLSHDATVVHEPVLAVSVTARLDHSSGQWKESSPLEIPCDGRMGAAQLIGSADTYGRRYTTCSILGVVADSDDDGTVASGQQAETGKKEPLPNCPKCGTNKSVIVGKPEYGGGFVCYKKKNDGCGHAWQVEEKSADGPTLQPESQSNGRGRKPVSEDHRKAHNPVLETKNKFSAVKSFASFQSIFGGEIQKYANPADDTAVRRAAIDWIVEFAPNLVKPEFCTTVVKWLNENIPDLEMRAVGMKAVVEQANKLKEPAAA